MALICCCLEICANADVGSVDGDCGDCGDCCSEDCFDCSCFSCCFHAHSAVTAVDAGLRTADAALTAASMMSPSTNTTYVPLVITSPPTASAQPTNQRPPNSQNPNEENTEYNTNGIINDEHRSFPMAPPSYDEAVMGLSPYSGIAPSAPIESKKDDSTEKIKQ